MCVAASREKGSQLDGPATILRPAHPQLWRLWHAAEKRLEIAGLSLSEAPSQTLNQATKHEPSHSLDETAASRTSLRTQTKYEGPPRGGPIFNL